MADTIKFDDINDIINMEKEIDMLIKDFKERMNKEDDIVAWNRSFSKKKMVLHDRLVKLQDRKDN
jgi:hypothetical protein